ncbi:Per1-like-domain-containing protein [Mycotypha africana]|uniref:Per1-like-domain-containing protein n=1 Tax=Mycotypha africana TaxID=64632 RepID=UPI002301D447|nr:Per1-like-domain-containing protein [Mycotypha africana]KAI8979218.1 Per1-like-domain-containing protein [Mycotypha africana]
MQRASYLFLSLFIILNYLTCRSFASEGDDQPAFNHCVDECVQLSCPVELDFFLKLLKWSCSDNCKYTCMQSLTDKALQEGTPVYQYYGKWPFYRFLGIQEPASVIFSIGNGLVNLYYFQLIRKKAPSTSHLRGFLILYTLLGMNAWLWSTIFHTRDRKFTELMDYFSAGLLVLYSLFYAIIRVCRVRNSLAIKWLGTVFVCLYVAHVGKLTIVSFDYTYNMYANVIVGACQILVWSGWYIVQMLKKGNNKSMSYARLGIISGLGVSLAASLELFDFPPIWRTFDAHSLWHLSTIPLTALWYMFLMEDLWHEANHENTFTSYKLLP